MDGGQQRRAHRKGADLAAAEARNQRRRSLLERIGSDVEIAQRIIEKLEEIYGQIVFAEGRFWRFDRTHWMALE
jgi:hypothetical protein